jgi:hypothetical protein
MSYRSLLSRKSYFKIATFNHMSQDRSVTKMTGCGLDDRGFITSKDRIFFFSSPPCCPLSLLLMDLVWDAD